VTWITAFLVDHEGVQPLLQPAKPVATVGGSLCATHCTGLDSSPSSGHYSSLYINDKRHGSVV
jgi:hypothetical protein